MTKIHGEYSSHYIHNKKAQKRTPSGVCSAAGCMQKRRDAAIFTAKSRFLIEKREFHCLCRKVVLC